MEKRKWICAAACAVLTALSAQGMEKDTLRYRLTLTDKAATTYSLQRPEEFLSPKAVQRRHRQGLPIDSTDLPVCRDYLRQIQALGVRIVLTGKWQNVVTVACADTSVVSRLLQLPFVRKAEWVASYRPGPSASRSRAKLADTPATSKYDSEPQVALCRGRELHAAGYRGRGMTIAVTDAGFHNADRIPAMKNLQIAGVRDFVRPGGDVYAEHPHGLAVLSCMAMNREGVMTGTAPEASYWLLRTEDTASEQPIEEDYWAAAVEFADSLGADVISSSVGYSHFDRPEWNYRLCQLDGYSTLMSRQASMIADKGMVLVCAAGNEGMGAWKKICIPSDAHNVLTVGAVNLNGVLEGFSSVGPSADGRIKPDIVARGGNVVLMGTDGNLRTGDGTSYSTPIVAGLVACLWQACPEWTARQVMDAVRRSADRSTCPDSVYGYGVPDMQKAMQLYQPTIKP